MCVMKRFIGIVFRRGLLVVAAFALVVAACGGDGAGPATAAPPIATTPAPPSTTTAPTPAPEATPVPSAAPEPLLTIALPSVGIQAMALTTAVEGGFFDKRGANVTLMPMGDATEIMMAIRQGRVDIAVVPLLLVAQSLDSPRPLVAIGAVAGSLLNVVVAGGIAQDLGLTIDSPLQDRLSGLEGLRIGHPPGPLGVKTAQAVVEAAGFDPGQDVELISVPGEDQVAALAAGDIDALVAHHPHLEEAIVDEGAMLLLHLTGGEVPSAGAFPLLVLAVPTGGAKDEEALTSVLAALAEAQQAIHDDPTIAMLALESAFPDLSGPLLEQGLNIYLASVPTTPVITPEGYDTALRAFGVGAVPFDQVVDNSFAEAAATR
jgi:ABC-type nitrate/sulfonate/bicarbonate transport system substrate-binding protein